MSDLPLLIADGDLESLEMLKATVQEGGYAVRTASSLEEVKATLTEGPFALMLLSGDELLGTGTENLLALLHPLDDPPELLLIADGEDLDVATALLERGSGDYLARPFTSNQLMEAIETGQVRSSVRRERADLENRLDDVRRRFDEATDRQSALVRTIDQRRDRILDQLESENRDLRQKLQVSTQESSREAAERLGLVEDRLEDTQKECDRVHQECERLTEQLRIEREDHTQVLSEVQRDAGETRRLLEESQRAAERMQADFESKARSSEEQATLDSREFSGQLRHLEETRDALQGQLDDFVEELSQARDARRDAEEERRKLKDELMEQVSGLTERLELRDSEADNIQRRHGDLERTHAELVETHRNRTTQLEDELDELRIDTRRHKDNSERVRIRLEKHLETKNGELRAMAEERSVLRSRIKNLDEDLQKFSAEVASKEEERDTLFRDLESRARRAEKEGREAQMALKRGEERYRTETQNFERKLADREREVQRLSRENNRLAEYLRTERANLSTRLEAGERRIQSLMAAKNMLNDEFGKRLEDQAARLERLTREHEHIAADHQAVVERLENEVEVLRDGLVQRETDLQAVVLERERLERTVREKDRLVGQLTLEARELRRLLGRETDVDSPLPLVEPESDPERDPGVPLEARGEPLGATITEEEYAALRGGWGDLSASAADESPTDDLGALPPGFQAQIEDAEVEPEPAQADGLSTDASASRSPLPPGFADAED